MSLRILSFGGDGGIRYQIKPAELATFSIHSGVLIDSFSFTDRTLGGVDGHGGLKTTKIPGGGIAGMQFDELQSTMTGDIEVICYT